MGEEKTPPPADPVFVCAECPQCAGFVGKEDVRRQTWYRAGHGWFHSIQQICPHCGDGRLIVFRFVGGIWAQQGNTQRGEAAIAGVEIAPSAEIETRRIVPADQEEAGDRYEVDQRFPRFEETEI